MDRRMTRTEAEMESKLQALDPESERFKVLSAARQFKASWIHLGAILTKVREAEAFKDWGYTNFDAYCRRELFIKKDTANKLTRSYSFLRDHEPRVLEEPTSVSRELPALDVVDLLTRAREKTKVSDEQLNEITREVLSDSGKPATKNAVVKKFRELDPDAFRTQPKTSVATGGRGDLKKAVLLAERLQVVVEALDEVSDGTRSAMANAVKELQALFEAQRLQPEAELQSA